MNNTILLGITGSKAYGLNHADSDTDTLGIFVSQTVEVANLDWHRTKETLSNASPEGDDFTLHEVGKYCRLALQSNPTLIELLFLDHYQIIDEHGRQLIEMRKKFLSRTFTRSAYHGYAYSQLVRLKQAESFKPKMARHALRIARQGIDLLATGEVSVRLANPQEYFDLTEMPYDDMIRVLEKDIGRLLIVESVLPSAPDRATIKDFMSDVRRKNLG